MKFALKIGSLFCNVIVVYKIKIKGVIKNLNSKKKIVLMKIVKIYLGISLELLWAMMGQFRFR